MADVKWIKIATDIFDNRKIKQIEAMPKGEAIIVIWIKLICLAGVINDGGMMYFTDGIPDTPEMLATQFTRPVQIIRLALDTFERFGMIDRTDGFISLPSWGKYQSTDKLEKMNASNRERQARHRAKKRDASVTEYVTGNVTATLPVTQSNATDIDIDKDKEKDIKDLIVSKDTIRQTDVKRTIDEWNTLEEFGITPVKRMTPKREQAVKARIRQNHIDDILEAIENIRHSSFLQGQNKNGWMVTFDWFLKPGNFAKVFEGQYADKSTNRPCSYMEKIQNRVSEVDNWV